MTGGDEGTPESDATGEETVSEPVAVKLRGIYTTALTGLFDAAGHEVVQASPPIRRRFDADFSRHPWDARVSTGPDRQGVGVDGTPEATATVRERLGAVGIDVLSWTDPVPTAAVFDGVVTETLGGGAVVDLGVDADGGHDGEGYLPFDEADGYVETGDEVRVQVDTATAPWTDDRPELTTTLRAPGGLATLVRGREETRVRGGDAEAARELAGMTDLLDAETPDGWGIEWNRAAPEAELDALRASLTLAAERATAIDDALDGDALDGDAPGGDEFAGDTPDGDAADTDDSGAHATALATPLATAWVWFGRASRFALDDHRRAVTSTMPGHHRTKAASRDASAGVDFAEALCSFDDTDAGGGGDGTGADTTGGGDGTGAGDTDDADDLDFPFTVVTDQFGPVEGDRIGIDHGKPDGRLVSLGRGEVVSRQADGTVTVERSMSGGGTYDALGTPRAAGDTARTKFVEGRWWYPTVYRSADGESKGTYVNVCTPVEVFPDAVRYVDLHVDVVKYPDGTVERVDDDELDAAVASGALPEATAERARAVARAVERGLQK